MSRFLYIAALLATMMVFQGSSMAQNNNANLAQEAKKAAAADQVTQENDRIYSSKEITQKAVIKSRPNPDYYPGSGEWGRIKVVIRAIFRASGEVYPVKVYSISPENLPDYIVSDLIRSCVNAARKIKFKPALKDGRPVSHYVQLEYRFH